MARRSIQSKLIFRPSSSGPAAALAAILALAPGLLRAAGAHDPDRLESAGQVLALSDAEVEKPRHVVLRGVVTGSDLGGQSFYIQDSTAGIRILASARDHGLQLKDQVEVEGVTRAGRLAPCIQPGRIRLVGKARLPSPVRVSLLQISAGMRDGQWVAVSGIVRSVDYRNGHPFLRVASGDERIFIHLPEVEKGRPPSWYVDAKVKAEGVCVSRLNNVGEFMGGLIMVPDVELLAAEHRQSSDPYSSPLIPLRNVLHFRDDATAEHRIHVRGTVVLRRPGISLFLTDGADNLYVRASTEDGLKPGDEVDVLGFPDFLDESPTLTDVMLRRTGRHNRITPVQVRTAEIINPRYDLALVAIEARLVESSLTDGSQEFVFHSGDRMFQAILEEPRTPESLAGLRQGSLVRVVGLCILARDDENNPVSFKLRLRSDADIQLLKAPSWWTIGRVAALSAALAAVALVVLIWMVALRRRVRSQTTMIRKRLEHEAALEEKYQDLVENANDIVGTIDMDGTFTSVNGAGARISGYSREELVGRRVGDLLTAESGKNLQEAVLRVRQGEELGNCEWEIVTRDGARISLEASLRVMKEASIPVGLQVIARNVTERRRAEQMRIAMEAAEAANLAKSQFLANMSHEIRTPLNAVIGYSELLVEEVESQGLSQFIPDLEKIRSAGKHLLALINDILDLSKIEAGKMQVLPETFRVAELVDEVAATAAPLVERNRNTFRVEVEGEIGTARTDRTRVRQILLNLLSNAGKFTADGDVRLRARREHGGGRELIRFSVRDTGIGISAENQKKLFRDFTQVDPSTTRKHGGTGLGLAISLRFSEMLGGTIRLESAPGRGSTFEVVLPVDIPAREAESNTANAKAIELFVGGK